MAYDSTKRKGKKRGPYKQNKNTHEMSITKEKVEEIKSNLDKVEEVIKLEKEITSTLPVKEDTHEDLKQETIKEEIKEEIKPDSDFKQKTGEEELDSFLSDFKDVTKSDEEKLAEAKEKAKEERKKKKEVAKLSESEQKIVDSNSALFNGTMLISMCDFFFPGVIKFMYTKFIGNKTAAKVKHSDVVLKPGQIESISDVSDHAAKVIFEKVHPIALFVIGMSVMYFMNFRMALDNVEEKEEEAKKKLAK